MSRDDYEQLKQALRAAKMGVWDVDVASGTVHCSPEIESLCGIPPGTFGGANQAIFQCVHPEDRARIAQVSRDLLAAGSGAHAVRKLRSPPFTAEMQRTAPSARHTGLLGCANPGWQKAR